MRVRVRVGVRRKISATAAAASSVLGRLRLLEAAAREVRELAPRVRVRVRVRVRARVRDRVRG